MKKILLLMFILFSFSFGDNIYKTTYEKSFKQTKKQEKNNNLQIEELMSDYTNMDQVINHLNDAYSDQSLDTTMLKLFFRNIKFTITNIHYIDSKKAIVTLENKIPIFDEIRLNEIIKKRFYDYTNLSLDDLSDEKFTKYFSLFMEITNDVYENSLTKNSNFKTESAEYPIKKVNNKWIVTND